MDKYAQNKLLDNSVSDLRLVNCLKDLISMPECTKIRIATGYWDLPGTKLVYDELKEFLEVRGGELEILIGEDPHLYKSQLSELPKGERFPDFYIKQDFEKLTYFYLIHNKVVNFVYAVYQNFAFLKLQDTDDRSDCSTFTGTVMADKSVNFA